MDDIIRVVSEMTDVSVDEILSRSRRQEVCEARQIFIYICHRDRGKTLRAIAKYLGNRKSQGISLQFQNFDQQVRIYKLLRKKVNDITNAVILL